MAALDFLNLLFSLYLIPLFHLGQAVTWTAQAKSGNICQKK